MNKRIRELIAEADRKCSETRGIYDEILAELVVRECIDGIANDTANYEGVGMMSYYQGVQDAVKSIRKQFGVEE